MLSKLLVDIRLQRTTRVDVFQAIEMLAASWAATEVDVIKNCLQKAGFCDKENLLPRDQDCGHTEGAEGNSAVAQELSEAWQSLGAYEDAVPQGTTLEDFLQSDADVVATEELDDAEIVRSIRDDDYDDSGGEDIAYSNAFVPSGKDVLDAIDILRRYAGAQDNMEEAVEAIWRYERVVMAAMQQQIQTKLTDYFGKK